MYAKLVSALRAVVMQQMIRRGVRLEIPEQTRESLLTWIQAAGRRSDDDLFPSRIHGSSHLSTDGASEPRTRDNNSAYHGDGCSPGNQTGCPTSILIMIKKREEL